jgi:hypothetical protein
MPEKRKTTKREQVLFAALLFIFIAFWVKKGVYELRAGFSRLDEEISVNEKELARLRGVLKQAGEISAEYEEAFTGYKGLRSSDNLLQELGAIARSLDFNILSIKPAFTENTPQYRSYAIKIEIQDDIPTLAGFLYKLTEGLKGIGVEQLQVKAQKGEELPRISMTLNAVIFK